MATKPSLLQYVGVVSFLTVVTFYTVRGLTRGMSDEFGFLALLVSLAVVQISVTYLLVRSWVEYAVDGDHSTPDGNAAANPSAGD